MIKITEVKAIGSAIVKGSVETYNVFTKFLSQ